MSPILLAVVCSFFLLTAQTAEAGKLPNKYCPVTTTELAEEQFFVDYQERRIYFCCNGCKKDFLKDPQAYLANLDARAPDSDQSQEPHHHEAGAHDHVASTTEVTTDVTQDVTNHDASAQHDHSSDHGDSSSLVSFAGKFHPMLTHFPIALVLAALLFSILSLIIMNQTLDYVSVYSIYLAALMGVGTVILGLAAGSAASYPSFLTNYLDWHRTLGIATGIVTILTAYFGRRFLNQQSKQAVMTYRISLFVNAILVGITGHFGAILVFGPDHFNF